ncbi:class I SAM-dependent methyltransferase [Anabaena cylindrica UHCC 0172]|uniref:O-methyltransferase n=1 Tax=Anabaena cylindrica TaxID=1165 RepID=UPI002B211EE3|nr:class I SAM-dependent methyltransferase [Anabaena cylindrica]MEA5550656.1 class I SAM-dependent methyltransferase [Anabaena cylindrica UHCC 0172]
MNPILQEALTTDHVKNENGEIIPLHSHIPRLQGEFLQQIIAELKPKVTLEVGLAYGISGLFICDQLKSNQTEKNHNNQRHIIIDPYQLRDWQNIGLNNLKKAGYEAIIEFHDQPSHIVLPLLESQGVKIDFAFIDGMHTFDHTLVDFFNVDRLLNVGGILAIDDTNFPSVAKVCRFILTNRAYSVSHVLTSRDDRSPTFLKMMHILIKSQAVPQNRCIAFRKEAEDYRNWHFYEDF